MRNQSSIDQIQTAIHSRRQLTIVYNREGTVPGARLVNPHVLYETSTGKTCLHAVQVSGPTSSGRGLPDWGIFDLEHLELVEVGEASFEVDPKLNLKNHSMYRVVHCSVEDAGSH